jgi:glycosyltransferase involved in cell wall biosynthesis
MSQGSVELDVCMVAHGVGPATVGGVTRWADALARELPALRIEMHRAGDELPLARCYHALMPAAVPAAADAARSGRRPVLLTLHAMADPWEPVGWRGRIDPEDWSHGGGGGGGGGNHGGNSQNTWIDRTYAAADRIVAVGTAVAGSHRWGSGRSDIEVIANGVDAGRLRAARSEPVVGFVGRLAPIKRLERLLDAMALVREVNREAQLVLVGPDEGPPGYGEHLRGLADRPGLRGAVTFTGPAWPERWFPQFAVMAMSSDTEGMPLAVLEARAHGVPCVGPDVGGMREAIAEGGLVVAPGDAEALAAGILAVLGDTAHGDRLADAAFAASARWTAADTAAAYADLYAGLDLR